MKECMRLISSMQELMDRHGYKYPYFIEYAYGDTKDHVNVNIQPVCTDRCGYSAKVWGDNDNNSSK